jgi:gamma-glutamyltranspeptidase / glutathione hydrolase
MSEGIKTAAVVGGRAGTAVVAGGSPATVAAAAALLRDGGNAMDAALAGMFASAMAEPVLSSLGGGGFCLHAAPGQPPQYLDFFVDTPGIGRDESAAAPMTSVRIVFGRPDDPQAEQVFHAGWSSVAVPGCFTGYLDAHARWGSLPLAQVVAPAIRLAREGIVLDPIQWDFLRLVADVLAVTSDSAALYAPAMRGEPFRNPGYADLLEAIADGATMSSDIFATPLLAAMSSNGGLITADDLHSYAPRLRQPLTMMREGAAIWTNPPPSFGGAIVLEALGQVAPEPIIDWVRVAMSLRDATARNRARNLIDSTTQVSRGTTSISVADSDGFLVTCTTSNGSSSGTQIDGVQLNNMLGEEDLNSAGAHARPAGQRMSSMMTPTMVEQADGSRITFGSGGSERIRSAHVGVLARLIDSGSTLADSVAGPRVHATPEGVEVEPGIDPTVFASWDDVGRVRMWPQRDLYFGGVHAVGIDAEGRRHAVGDSRRGGVAAIIATAHNR